MWKLRDKLEVKAKVVVDYVMFTSFIVFAIDSDSLK